MRACSQKRSTPILVNSEENLTEPPVVRRTKCKMCG
jgi:hypothetical protein